MEVNEMNYCISNSDNGSQADASPKDEDSIEEFSNGKIRIDKSEVTVFRSKDAKESEDSKILNLLSVPIEDVDTSGYPLMEPILYIGREFASFKEIEEAKEKYEEQMKMILVKKRAGRIQSDFRRVFTENPNEELIYSGIEYGCKFSGHPNLKVKRTLKERKRKVQRTTKLGCPFNISITISKDGQKLVVRNIVEEHNHVVDPETYHQMINAGQIRKEKLLFNNKAKEVRKKLSTKGERFERKEKEVRDNLFVKGLLRKVEESKIVDSSVVEQSSQMEPGCSLPSYTDITQAHIEPMVTRVAQDHQSFFNEEFQFSSSFSFENILKEMQKHKNCNVQVMVNGGLIEGVYIQTERMMKNFIIYPEILLIDEIYTLRNSGMYMYVIMIMDGNGKSRVISLSFVQYECPRMLLWIFQSFKRNNANVDRIKCIITDLDLIHRDGLLEYIPNAKLLIGANFCFRKFQREINTLTMNISASNCDIVMQLIQDILFAKDEQSYNDNIKQFELKSPIGMLKYFQKTWEPVKDEWVKGFRTHYSHYYIQKDTQLENINRKIKSVITANTNSMKLFYNLLNCVDNDNCDDDINSMVMLTKFPASEVSFNELAAYKQLLTPFAYSILEDHFRLTESLEALVSGKSQLQVTATECPCGFISIIGLPCRHIIAKYTGKSVISQNRWLKANYLKSQSILSKKSNIAENREIVKDKNTIETPEVLLSVSEDDFYDNFEDTMSHSDNELPRIPEESASVNMNSFQDRLKYERDSSQNIALECYKPQTKQAKFDAAKQCLISVCQEMSNLDLNQFSETMDQLKALSNLIRSGKKFSIVEGNKFAIVDGKIKSQ